MNDRQKERIMIDRYGNPLGTPPEIYKEKIEYKNNKNEIDHGNEFGDINNSGFGYNNFGEEFNYGEEKKIYQKNDQYNYEGDMNQMGSGEYTFGNEFNTNMHDPAFYGYNPEQEKYVDPKYYEQYGMQFGYENGGGEHPLYVNVKQYNCIRKRKLRRDYLDTLMKQANQAGYLHESRHKHAMNRLRAPSGRFLTKEETLEMQREQKNAQNK